MKPLDCILLVDDDAPTNFLHKHLLETAGCARQIVVARNGREALEILEKRYHELKCRPSMILLDINMPEMNGWEFLDAYAKIDPEQKGEAIVMMLTTSLNPKDRDHAVINPDVKAFKNKPLTKEALSEIVELYWALKEKS